MADWGQFFFARTKTIRTMPWEANLVDLTFL